MALVIFFVPQPEKGVAEMARVVKPGGLVSSYAWDMDGGGFPIEPFRAQMRAMGLKPMGPPREDASRIDVLRELWSGAGLLDLETKEITVHRTFTDFEEYWGLTVKGSSSLGPMIAKMTPGEASASKTACAQGSPRVPTDASPARVAPMRSRAACRSNQARNFFFGAAIAASQRS